MFLDFQDLTVASQESFIAHSAAEIVHSLYYNQDSKGLDVFIRNLETVFDYAHNCRSCLDILQQKGNVYAKINLLLEFLGQSGINEEFVAGLEAVTDKAQVCLEGSPSVDDENSALINLRTLMDRKNDEFKEEEFPFADILNGKVDALNV